MELKKLPSLLGNERGCGAFERSGEKALIDEGSSDARRMRRIFSRAMYRALMAKLGLIYNKCTLAARRDGRTGRPDVRPACASRFGSGLRRGIGPGEPCRAWRSPGKCLYPAG